MKNLVTVIVVLFVSIFASNAQSDFGGMPDFKGRGMNLVDIRSQIASECREAVVPREWVGRQFHQKVGRVVDGKREVTIVTFTMAEGARVFLQNGSNVPAYLWDCGNLIWPVPEVRRAERVVRPAPAPAPAPVIHQERQVVVREEPRVRERTGGNSYSFLNGFAPVLAPAVSFSFHQGRGGYGNEYYRPQRPPREDYCPPQRPPRPPRDYHPRPPRPPRQECPPARRSQSENGRGGQVRSGSDVRNWGR